MLAGRGWERAGLSASRWRSRASPCCCCGCCGHRQRARKQRKAEAAVTEGQELPEGAALGGGQRRGPRPSDHRRRALARRTLINAVPRMGRRTPPPRSRRNPRPRRATHPWARMKRPSVQAGFMSPQRKLQSETHYILWRSRRGAARRIFFLFGEARVRRGPGRPTPRGRENEGWRNTAARGICCRRRARRRTSNPWCRPEPRRAGLVLARRARYCDFQSKLSNFLKCLAERNSGNDARFLASVTLKSTKRTVLR